jgi:hypothetical protein
MCSVGSTQTAESIDFTRIFRGNSVACNHDVTPLCANVLDKRGAEWVLSYVYGWSMNVGKKKQIVLMSSCELNANYFSSSWLTMSTSTLKCPTFTMLTHSRSSSNPHPHFNNRRQNV